jgi:hypothetical protein
MIKMEFQLPKKEVNDLLRQLPNLARSAAYDKGIPAAARVVRNRLKEITPRSSSSGSTKKWSKKTQAERAGELPLYKTVAIKMLRPKRGRVTALVGYGWPRGNKGHYTIPMKSQFRRVVLWGNDTGQKRRKGDDILKRAFDESKQQAAAAYVAGVKKEVDKHIARFGNG